MGEKRGALQPFWSGGAYTRFFEVPFIYDDLRDQGLRSIVIDQQAGLGLGNRNDTDQADDVWERFNFKFADTLALEVLNLAFGESSNSSGLDEDARQGAVAHIARTRGEFDLMVIYLAGLDHYLHEQGVSNNQGSDFFLTQVDDLFDESLHDNINVIVKTIEEKIGDQATIYGVFADHGHFDVDPEKRMDFDNNGSVLEDRGFLEWNAVLAPDKKFRVGNRYEEIDENGVVGILAAHESWFCFLLEELRDWVPWRLFFQNPPDGSLRDAVACSGEDLRDAFVATETRPSHQMDEAPHRIGETSNGRLRSTREPTDSLSAFTSRSQRVTVLTETQQRVAVSLRDQPRSFLSSRIRNRWCGV